MKNEEIQKLLGGYATNSLTDAEQKALFQAALEDQELFDALQQEQPLKDLLDDPFSRRQVREALEGAPARSPAWWSRWWTWGVAGGAVAAALTVAVALRPGPVVDRDLRSTVAQAELKAPEVRTSAPAAARKAAPRPRVAPPVANHSEPIAAAPQPASAAPAEVQVAPPASQPQSIVTNSFRDAQSSVPSLAAPMGGGFRPTSLLPKLTYSILKRDESGSYSPVEPRTALHPGDAVRLNVFPATTGYLSLYERDSSGEWKRLYPATGSGIQVNANTAYMVPDSPIDIQGEKPLRLVLSPAPFATAVPAVLEITLGAKPE